MSSFDSPYRQTADGDAVKPMSLRPRSDRHAAAQTACLRNPEQRVGFSSLLNPFTLRPAPAHQHRGLRPFMQVRIGRRAFVERITMSEFSER